MELAQIKDVESPSVGEKTLDVITLKGMRETEFMIMGAKWNVFDWTLFCIVLAVIIVAILIGLIMCCLIGSTAEKELQEAKEKAEKEGME